MIEFLPLVFFTVALFYSSVGFGGGSSYLAILSLVLVDFYEIRSLALVLNITVVSIGTAMYIRNNVFDLKKFWPFIVFSVPVAFLGAQLKLSQISFFIILGSALLLSSFFLILQTIKPGKKEKELSWKQRGSIGAAIGFLSGVAGIGGGIFLSPVLNLYGWATPRVIASLASIFIWANSISGVLGLYNAETLEIEIAFAGPIFVAVLLGGFLGAYLSNTKINLNWIRILTALLVGYIGLRIVLLYSLDIKI
jgi:hypothetical protein